MTDTAAIVIGADVPQARKPIVIELVGVKYLINPPKTLNYLDFVGEATTITNTDVAARIASGDLSVVGDSMGLINKWIDMAFGEEAEAVRARLTDPGDSLEIIHVSELMKAVSEVITGGQVPPTLPSA